MSPGPVGSLWGINGLYNAGDDTHYNAAGHARIAQVIRNGICSVTT